MADLPLDDVNMIDSDIMKELQQINEDRELITRIVAMVEAREPKLLKFAHDSAIGHLSTLNTFLGGRVSKKGTDYMKKVLEKFVAITFYATIRAIKAGEVSVLEKSLPDED